jgi:acylphosphatase
MARLYSDAQSQMKRQRVHVFYSGRVQGVGFRYTTKNVAAGYEVTGTVRNLADGRVEMVIEGEKTELVQFLQGIRDSEVGGLIRQEQMAWSDGTGEFRGFEITR